MLSTKIKLQSTFIVILLLLVSCDFLNLTPEESVDSDVVFTSKSNVQAVLTGAYEGLQGVIPAEYEASEIAGDGAKHSGSLPRWNMIYSHNVLPFNEATTDIWDRFYNVILRVNSVIKYTPSVDDAAFSQTEKDAVVAEAKIIRAFSYHSLVRWFGDVPLVLEPVEQIDESIYELRSSESAVYDQIISDLTDAQTVLGLNGQSGAYTANGLTASALLSRVYLYTGEYSLAEAAASDVIDSGVYSLADYDEIFSGKSSEEIFTLHYNEQNGNGLAFFAFPVPEGGRYEYAPTTSFINSFESSDERLAVNVRTLSGQPTIYKYNKISNGDDDVNIVRLGEVMLNRAEARVQMASEAQTDFSAELADLNDIRNRVSLAAVTAASKQQALDMILEERWHELYAEGHRFHDLKRFGVAQQRLNISNSNYLLWPIPQKARDATPGLGQNDGY